MSSNKYIDWPLASISGLGYYMKNRKLDAPWIHRGLAAVVFAALIAFGCAPQGPLAEANLSSSYDGNYIIGPGDQLEVFVWQNPQLSVKIPVRPDGRVSIPLVEDIDSAGKTPTELARVIEQRLKAFVNDPIVTVIVNAFSGPYASQVRIVGEAVKPNAIAYRRDMTILDAMIAVGGLTPYAAGNRTTLVRTENGRQQSLRVRLDDLLKDGVVAANVALRPGDIVIVPQSYF